MHAVLWYSCVPLSSQTKDPPERVEPSSKAKTVAQGRPHHDRKHDYYDETISHKERSTYSQHARRAGWNTKIPKNHLKPPLSTRPKRADSEGQVSRTGTTQARREQPIGAKSLEGGNYDPSRRIRTDTKRGTAMPRKKGDRWYLARYPRGGRAASSAHYKTSPLISPRKTRNLLNKTRGFQKTTTRGSLEPLLPFILSFSRFCRTTLS